MSDWIEWHGGECPVAPGTIVEVKFEDGTIECNFRPEWSASMWNWYNNIIAYRVVSQPEAPNPVTSPAHYTAGDIECIDAIRAALTEEEFRGFCKGNVIKYTWRERHKGGNESLAKAVWYLERLIK